MSNTPDSNPMGCTEEILKFLGKTGTFIGLCSITINMFTGGLKEVKDYWPILFFSMLAVAYIMEIARNSNSRSK